MATRLANVTAARVLAGALLIGCAMAMPHSAGAARSAEIAPATITTVSRTTRAYFADLVAGRFSAAYALEAPCSAIIHLSQGTMGMPGRGPYVPPTSSRVRSAVIYNVQVTQDAVLHRAGLVEALVDGTFRFSRSWPHNDERPDGHHRIAILFSHCGGRWRLYEPWGGGGPYSWR